MFRQRLRRLPLFVLVLIGTARWFLIPGGSAAPPAKAEEKVGAVPFTLPPGLVAERIAGPPLVEHPVMACFDERGRLFVAESAGLNLPMAQLLKRLPDGIRVLEDADGDGRFDKVHVFAGKMTFPMGVLYHDGAVYVTAAPSLWRIEDRGGVAGPRRELVTKFGSTGNGADIHGPFLAPDGWLYWTDGRHGHEIRRPDGRVMKGLAARIFRCRPDGRDVEVVCGGGMDDPVEIAFTAEGEALATVDILIGSPRRIDALIHCVEGGVFPYHPCYKEFKQTGGLLPPVSDLGWVAPSGLTRYRGTALGAGYRDNLFSALFNTHRIQRHVLKRAGATFQASNEDFLVSTHPDCHPTDVLEDADGSLLVVDTGGWFHIGCPTSQTAKPEVPGGIYRVRRKDAPKAADPRGLKLPWGRLPPADLAALLDDPRWAVRDRAVGELGKRGRGAVEALREVVRGGQEVRARRNAVWALNRVGRPEARALIRAALADRDAGVRLAAAHCAGLERDAEALARLRELVNADTPAVRREAATGLGRLRRPEAVPDLLKGLQTAEDRFLEHALIYALIEIADPGATRQGLQDPSPRVRRGALIALDQMEGGNLAREEVVPFLKDADPALQQTVLDTVGAHPAWAGGAVEYLGRELAQGNLPEGRREGLRRALLALCQTRPVQELVARALPDDRTPAANRLLLLEVMAEAPLEPLPSAWVRGQGHCLDDREERVVRQAIVTLRGRGRKDFDDRLRRLAAETTRPAELRVAAAAAVAPRLPQVETALFEFLLAQLDPKHPPLARLAAAEALGQARLSEAQLGELARAVSGAGALELPHLVAAFEKSHGAGAGKQLVEALAKSPGLRSLSPEGLRRTLQDYPGEVRAAAGPLFRRLEVDAEKQKARLAELEAVLSGGNAVRGRPVFFGARAACSACHTVQSQGGKFGPDLTKIGSIRTGRDLLEAVVFPSASIVRGYEPYQVTTHDGRVHSGILGRETAEAIYLVTAERAEVRIPRRSIETFEPSRVSIMPQGLDGQLTRAELGDLLAFLQSLR